MLMSSLIKLTNELIMNYLSANALVFTYHIKHLGEFLIHKQIYAASCSQFLTSQFASSVQDRHHHAVWDSHSYRTRFPFFFPLHARIVQIHKYRVSSFPSTYVAFLKMITNLQLGKRFFSPSQTYSQFTLSLTAAQKAGITRSRQGSTLKQRCLPNCSNRFKFFHSHQSCHQAIGPWSAQLWCLSIQSWKGLKTGMPQEIVVFFFIYLRKH